MRCATRSDAWLQSHVLQLRRGVWSGAGWPRVAAVEALRLLDEADRHLQSGRTESAFHVLMSLRLARGLSGPAISSRA